MITPNSFYTAYSYAPSKVQPQITYLVQNGAAARPPSNEDIQAIRVQLEKEYQSKKGKDNFVSAFIGGMGVCVLNALFCKK